MKSAALKQWNCFQWLRTTRLQNSLFLRLEIENPSAFIKLETKKRKWPRGWERKGMGRGAEDRPCPLPHSFLLLSVRPFPLLSFQFDECAWIFDLPAKEETVLHSSKTSALLKCTHVWLGYDNSPSQSEDSLFEGNARLVPIWLAAIIFSTSTQTAVLVPTVY